MLRGSVSQTTVSSPKAPRLNPACEAILREEDVLRDEDVLHNVNPDLNPWSPGRQDSSSSEGDEDVMCQIK